MLDLLLSDIQDPVIRENFLRLSTFIKEQTILEGQWEFYQVEFNSAVTNFQFKHNLKFVPMDIITLSKEGDQNVYFRSENFTRTHIDITTSGPCRLRFLAGRYNKQAKTNKEFNFTPISGGGGGGGTITSVQSLTPASLSVTNPTGPNVQLSILSELPKVITGTIASGATVDVDTQALSSFKGFKYHVALWNDSESKYRSMDYNVSVFSGVPSDSLFGKVGYPLLAEISSLTVGPDLKIRIKNNETFTINYKLIRLTI